MRVGKGRRDSVALPGLVCLKTNSRGLRPGLYSFAPLGRARKAALQRFRKGEGEGEGERKFKSGSRKAEKMQKPKLSFTAKD